MIWYTPENGILPGSPQKSQEKIIPDATPWDDSIFTSHLYS